VLGLYSLLMIDRASKPGVAVTLDPDKSIEAPDANVLVQVYRFRSKPETSFALASATVNRPGGPFQAMMQTQRVIAADDPIDPEIPLESPKPVSPTPQ
jgi:hypothetical protein